MTKLADLSSEQRVQHSAVLRVALHNLLTVKDQVETLKLVSYDEILECLDSAQEVLEHKLSILKAEG